MYLNTPGVEWIHTTEATIVASFFAAVSIVISIIHIMQHLSHYTMPTIQIYVIRILIICPVYAMSSALAVGLGKNGQYAEVARDVYEAFVIYSFLSLILEYCGGETDCIYQIENEPLLKMPCPLCFMKPKHRDARLIRILKRGVLQFVIIKPIFAVIDIIMIATGEYYLLPYQLFEMTVYNISYTWALYCMYMFYLATNKIIKQFRPILKFASVKLIVFATYYQSLFVKASSMSPEDAIAWNDLLLCIEMVIFASILMLAYPTSEFQGGLPDSRLINNVRDVLKIKDVVQDVYHNFMPVYQEYTLQRSEKEAPETVRVKTYLAGNLDSVAIEMSHRYRGRNKRFAFNSLLRGSTPIRAQLRSRSKHFEEREGKKVEKILNDSDSECDDDVRSEDESRASSPSSVVSDTKSVDSFIKSSTSESELLYEMFMKQRSIEPRSYFLKHSDSSDDELNTSSDCLTANVQHSHVSLDQNHDFDIEAGVMKSHNKPNVLFHPLNPIEMDIYRRRVNFMRTHGIGLIVTDHGVEVRPSSYCPTEEESVVNVDFMDKDLHMLEHFRVTSSQSYEFPTDNVAASILPRITSSKKKEKVAKEHQKRAENAVRQEEIMSKLDLPIQDRLTFPPSNTSSPSKTPNSSTDNLKNLDDNSSCGAKTKSATDECTGTVNKVLEEKIKALPPISAIVAPRHVNDPTNLKNSDSNSSIEKFEVIKVVVTKEKRGISEGSEDWGDFQGNEIDGHESPQNDDAESTEIINDDSCSCSTEIIGEKVEIESESRMLKKELLDEESKVVEDTVMNPIVKMSHVDVQKESKQGEI